MSEKEIKIEEDELLEVLKNMTSKDLEKLIEELESVKKNEIKKSSCKKQQLPTPIRARKSQGR